MSLLGTRVAALIVLFILTILAGVVPVFLFRYWTKKRSSSTLDISGSLSEVGQSGQRRKKGSKSQSVVLQLLMFFGGGVLFATCFVHLIPEVRENFDEYFKSHNQSIQQYSGGGAGGQEAANGEDHFHDHDDDGHSHGPHDNHTHSGEGESSLPDTEHGHSHKHSHGVPYVELAICGGFFIIYFLEEVIHAAIGHNHESTPSASSETCSTTSGEATESVTGESLDAHVESTRRESYKKFGGKLDTFQPSFVSSKALRPPIGYDNYGVDLKEESLASIYQRSISQSTLTRNDFNKEQISSTSSETFSIGSKPIDHKLPALVRFIQGLVTVGAFSAHSIFDGVAIGLQTTQTQIWTMVFAICVHKLVVAFVVGMELYEQTKSIVITAIHMIIFSTMSPIGIILVIFTENSVTGGQSPVIIILSAVATGTILYIIFFEILRRDRGPNLPGLVQFSAMLVGFVVMLCVTLFVAHGF